MSKKKHWSELPGLLQRYVDSRKLDLKKFNDYQYRISDGGYIAIDIYTTRSYHIIKTCYQKLTKYRIIERQGERGRFAEDKAEMGRFLDRVFFEADILEEKRAI